MLRLRLWFYRILNSSRSRYPDQLPGKNLILALASAPYFFSLEVCVLSVVVILIYWSSYLLVCKYNQAFISFKLRCA